MDPIYFTRISFMSIPWLCVVELAHFSRTQLRNDTFQYRNWVIFSSPNAYTFIRGYEKFNFLVKKNPGFKVLDKYFDLPFITAITIQNAIDFGQLLLWYIFLQNIVDGIRS